MVFRYNFYVGYRDVDPRFKIKNSAILTFFEEIAGMHSTFAGEDIKVSDTTWVLTAYNVKILKQPEYGEKLEVSTWGTSIRGIFASREFEIRNEKNELLIIGLSNWVHINLKESKLEKVSPEIAKAYEIEEGHTNFNLTKLPKLDEPDEYEIEKSYQVNANWIDVNMHMNNIFYVEAAEMTLPEDIRKQNSYAGFEIMYKKEIKYKDKIKCLYKELEDSYVVAIKSENLKELHAVVKFNKK